MKQIIKILALVAIVFYITFAFIAWDWNWMNDGCILRIVYLILTAVFSAAFTPQRNNWD